MNRSRRVVGILLLTGCVALPIFLAVSPVVHSFSRQSKNSSVDALIGVWSSVSNFGPSVRGELTIDARGPEWRAAISGFDVTIQHENQGVKFFLPGDAGEFRGDLSPNAESISGYWIQPDGLILNNRYTSPVRLSAIGKSVWRGEVVPLDQLISLYASVQRESDGTLSAFISNPEMNFFRRRKFKVAREGSTVTLSREGQQLSGTLDESNDALSLPVVNWLPPFQFRRSKNKDAVGFSPRVAPDSEHYIYRKPIAEADGWNTASLAEVGMDTQPVATLVDKILQANPADNPTYIHSLLIARHGKLVLEEYFYGFSKERAHDMRSASKTFAPVLAGIVREQGAKLAPDTPVYSLFPQYKSFANENDRKKRVTLRDIMTMTAGNACDDNDDASPGNEDNFQSQKEQPDWYKFALDLPMVSDPGGSHAIYCSADLNLVGGVVASVTGMGIPQFFEDSLARPLQFGNYHLNLMPTGEVYMGGGAYLRPRDELKLGQLYLDGGMWGGHRVVSKEWVDESTTFHSRFEPVFKDEGDHQYGYGWHIHQLKVGERAFRVFAAEGNGGQYVIVIPELDLVVGLNGGSYGEFNKWYRWELDLIPQYVIPAASSTPTH